MSGRVRLPGWWPSSHSVKGGTGVTGLRTARGRTLFRWQASGLIGVLSAVAGPLLADVAAGKAVFAQCAGCHAVGAGAAHRLGPQLNGVLVRGAGTIEGYDFSKAFVDKVEAGLDWDEVTLDAYLQAPMITIPGTKMAYPGLKAADERANVIAYLASIDPDGSSVAVVAIAPAASPADTEQTSASDEPRPLAKDVPVPDHGVLHLGRPALEEEVAAWDIDVRPDGKGLPSGSGSVVTGGELYDAQCASCHGVFGEGEGRWPMLAGGFDTLTDDRPEKTIGSYWPYLSTVYDYVRRAMPFGNSRSLSDDDVYALTAYLLYMNDLADEEFTLTAENFAGIEMPNVASFIADTRSEEAWFESVDEPCMRDCAEGDATVAMRARVLDVTPDAESDQGGSEGLD